MPPLPLEQVPASTLLSRLVWLLVVGALACGPLDPSEEFESPAATATSELSSLSCSAGTADCDLSAANGCEATLGSDLANCGVCGNACKSGYSCNSGQCYPLATTCGAEVPPAPVAGCTNIAPTAISYTASGQYNSEVPANAGRLCGGTWNAGAHPTQWWQATWATPRVIRGVTLGVRMGPAGDSTIVVETSEDGVTFTPRYTLSQTMTNAYYPVDFGTLYRVLAVRIKTTRSPSWVSAWEYGIYSCPETSNYQAPMPRTRMSFGLATTDSGKTFAVGGTGSTVSSVDRYEPLSNTWTQVASLPYPRVDLAVAAVGEKVYAIGGKGTDVGSPYHDYRNTLYEYDPATNIWSERARMAYKRTQFAAAVHGGKIYVFGGINGGPVVSAVEAYDPATNTWTITSTLPTTRRYPVAAAANGKIYVMGGRGAAAAAGTTYNPGSTALVEVYDPASNTWTTGPSLPTPRDQFALVRSPATNLLYAVGGAQYTYYSSTSTSLVHLRRVDAFNPTTGSWSQRPDLTSARSALGGTLLPANGKVLLAGGYNGASALSSTEFVTP